MSASPLHDNRPTRCRLDVRGRVQGVGFRPFVYRLATELRLAGLVGNDVHGAFIEIEGPAGALDVFVRRLQEELPPLAQIAHLSRLEQPARADSTFRIEHSEHTGHQDAEITPDIATCDQCLAELINPNDRRYRYPFINCTNCGPRYSIVRAVPYDRPNTTMARFRMCPACQAEYDDPANRRFHAQPNACPECGPRVWLTDSAGVEMAGDPITECARLLNEGRIVAIKGIGGFHLACRADSEAAVGQLRERKGREAKPLAVMARDLPTARTLAIIDAVAAGVLTRPERPIVLLPRRDGAPIAPNVAPDIDRLGVMLPYTPLHHLLLDATSDLHGDSRLCGTGILPVRATGWKPVPHEQCPGTRERTYDAGPRALVMTSGNPTEEPLCCENHEALRRLAHMVDAFLLHDREIERRVDDSVVLATERPEAPAIPIRRARGYAPAPIEIGFRTATPVLAVGGELKSTVCLLSENQAVVSEHLGELPNMEAYRQFLGTIEQFKQLLQIEPAVVGADMHPEYAATRYAESLGLPVVKVQHHHAHLASCMADNGLSGPVIGIICDGTGYGPDGAIWGCEVLVGDESRFDRAAHLAYYPLPGGDAGARETWRPAAGLLCRISNDIVQLDPSSFRRVDRTALDTVVARLRTPERLPRTSSLGRLFDAAAFLIGICDRNRYEAEAAMLLEAVARRSPPGDAFPYEIIDGMPIQINVGALLSALIERRQAGEDTPSLARAFHETVATMLFDAAHRTAQRTNLDRVVLSGGCLANRLLSDRIRELLTAGGLQVFEHRQVPPGDGGIALGQAVAAGRWRIESCEWRKV